MHHGDRAPWTAGTPRADDPDMITTEDAARFAQEWLAAWNAHDLERILAHWSDDCVFSSPLVPRLLGEPSGTVRGKEALRAYWSRGLSAAPGLRFEQLSVLVGHDSIVLRYRNQRGQSCAEWIRIGPDDRAVEGAAHYADDAA